MAAKEKTILGFGVRDWFCLCVIFTAIAFCFAWAYGDKMDKELGLRICGNESIRAIPVFEGFLSSEFKGYSCCVDNPRVYNERSGQFNDGGKTCTFHPKE